MFQIRFINRNCHITTRILQNLIFCNTGLHKSRPHLLSSIKKIDLPLKSIYSSGKLEENIE